MANPQHRTLVANTAATVTLDLDYPTVEVTNVDGVDAVYFTTDGSTPSVGGDGSHVLPAAIGAVEINPRTSGATVVKLKSASAVKVSVRGIL